MRSAWAASLAWVVASALAASCSGADFGEGGVAMAEAGSDGGGTDGSGPDGGGAPTSMAGSSTKPHAGESSSEGGSGVVSGTGGAAAGAAGEPHLPDACAPDDAPTCATKHSVATCKRGMWEETECESGPTDCSPATCSAGKCKTSSFAPVEPQGDCKQITCAFGELTNGVDLNDVPAAKGVCDVASCTEAGPKWTDDNGKCAANKKCTSGACECRTCPNGKLDNVVADTCRMPVGVVATSNHDNMGSTPAGAIDGNAAVTWNSGQNSGQLTLTFTGSQPMTALVIYLTGQAGGNPGSKTIGISAKLDVADGGMPITKGANYSFTDAAPTGPIRIELGLLKVSKITLDFSSQTTWIAVNEVLFGLCNPDL